MSVKGDKIEVSSRNRGLNRKTRLPHTPIWKSSETNEKIKTNENKGEKQ